MQQPRQVTGGFGPGYGVWGHSGTEGCRAHAEVFSDAPPATSLVHVLPFVDEDMLIEVELIAERVR
jgi:hypothetical protein